MYLCDPWNYFTFNYTSLSALFHSGRVRVGRCSWYYSNRIFDFRFIFLLGVWPKIEVQKKDIGRIVKNILMNN